MVPSANSRIEMHGTRRLILSNRNFTYLYLGGLVSVSGSTITSLILVWLVYSETKSAIAITYLGIASLLPTITLGLLTGVVVDRLNRRILMIASDLIRAAFVAAIPVLLIWKGFSLPMVLVVVGIVGVFSTIFRPATNSLLPMLVPGESVQGANGLISASNSIVQMISNAVGGLLIGLAGVTLGLFYNTATYVVSALMIFLIVVPPHLRDGGTRNSTFLSDFKDGLQFIRKNKAVFESTVSATLLNFFATMVGSFFVVYVSGHLMESGTFFGFLVAALGLGIAGGSLVVGRLNTVSYAGNLFIISSIGFGLTTILLASTRSLQLAVIFVASMGVCLGLINTTFFSVMQLVVPNEILGRVLSVDEVGSFAAIPLGQIVAGLVISGSGIAFNYLIAGTGIILTAIAMMFLKDLRNFRYVPTS
jgi:DHA3 family macrolide efflux protein-like MFS transporter